LELENNPTNRQLFVSAWNPALDGLGGPQPKNIPCPIGFSVSRSKDDIHMSVFVRSSDVFVGLPYDVMGYALTLDAIAASVGCRPSTLHFTLAHPHYYEPHFQMVEDCVGHEGSRTEWTSHVQPTLPGWTVSMILNDPDGYVDTMKRLANRAAKSTWNPKPMVIV
jgi:thymidylate synthase